VILLLTEKPLETVPCQFRFANHRAEATVLMRSLCVSLRAFPLKASHHSHLFESQLTRSLRMGHLTKDVVNCAHKVFGGAATGGWESCSSWMRNADLGIVLRFRILQSAIRNRETPWTWCG